MGEKFERMTAEWTPERLADFLERRYKLLTAGPGNICEPARVKSHAPYYEDMYQYRDLVGSFSMPPWPELIRLPPEKLVHPNPFEISLVRKSKTGGKCYRCWDSVVAIPACKVRDSGIYDLAKVPAVRNINTHWSMAMRQAFSHVGPLGPGGRVLRPCGPYVLDLAAMGDFGWTIREAAHVLAHLRGDTKPNITWYDERNKVGWHNVAALTELAYGLIFDVPIDVTDKNRGRPGEPDTYYGVELKSTSYIQSPLVRLPVNNRESLRFDETLAVMLFAAFTEPVPNGFLDRTTKYAPEDRWAGGPSLVAIVGWECVDFLTHMHQAKIANRPESPLDYAIRGVDLLPPEDHWAYLALAKMDRPEPDTSPGSRWRYVREWVQSEDYLALRAQTPNLPCIDCYLINKDTVGAPKRPRGPIPTGPRKTWPRPWQEFSNDVEYCIGLGKKAVADYEPLYYSNTGYPKLDDGIRKSAHNARLVQTGRKHADARLLARIQAKLDGKIPGALTPREYARYEQHKLEQRSEQIRKTVDSGS